MIVQFNWIHGFHLVEEDTWRYCYSFSRPNEYGGFVVEWLAKQHEATSQRVTTPVVAANASTLVCEKGKRKIVYCMEDEKSCKFRANLLVEKAVMVIEAKRH